MYDSTKYRSAIVNALCIHCILGVATLLMLDFGESHRAFQIAFLAHWLMVGVIVFRRPSAPTKLDLAFIRYGVIPIFLATLILGPRLLQLVH